MEEVTIYSNGCKMYGTIYFPSLTIKEKRPCICIVPGGSGRTYKTPESTYCGLEELAQQLAEKGFITLTYDGRGQGKSKGKRTGHKSAQDDLHAVLQFLSQHPQIDDNRIGVFCQCAGGSVAVYEAAVDGSKIKSLILWGTPPSFTRCLRDGRLAEAMQRCKERGIAYGESFDVLDAGDIIDRVSQPVLIAGGTEDRKYFLIDEQICFFKRAEKSKNVMFLWVGRTPHRFSAVHSSFPTIVGMFASWFWTTL